MCDAAPVSVSSQKERPFIMLGLLASALKLRYTSTLKVNVPTLDVSAFGVPLLSLNDSNALVMAAGAEATASNEVAARLRIIFFILVSPDFLFSELRFIC